MSETKKYMSFGSDHLFPHSQLCFFAESENECSLLFAEVFNQPIGKYAFVYDEILENNGPVIGYVFSKNNRTQKIQSFLREIAKKGEKYSFTLKDSNSDVMGELLSYDGDKVYVEDNRSGSILALEYDYIQAIA